MSSSDSEPHFVREEHDFDNLLSVNSTKKGGIFEVRVLRRWMVPDYSRPGTFGGVRMVLVDISVSDSLLICVFLPHIRNLSFFFNCCSNLFLFFFVKKNNRDIRLKL
jgi:hypothetical protein